MVNGENSGRTKLLYINNKGLGSANKKNLSNLTHREEDFSFFLKSVVEGELLHSK